MEIWKGFLRDSLWITLFFVIILNGQSSKAGPKPELKGEEGHAIIGEIDEGDANAPLIENDDNPFATHERMAADDHVKVTPLKEKYPPLPSPGMPKAKEQKPKDFPKPPKNKKQDKKRAKIMEGFAKAEEFHKSWFNAPPDKVKASCEKLTKFCKVACTRAQCADAEVANHCHLMCPKSTIRDCPDPLHQGGGSFTEEEGQSTISVDDSLPHHQPPLFPQATSPVDLGEEG